MEGEELMDDARVIAIVAEALARDAPQLWAQVEETAIGAVLQELATRPVYSYAITTGDTAVPVTGSNGLTYQTVAVWLDGDAQTSVNKRAVQLPYGVTAPAANQYWQIQFSQGRGAPGLLDKRLA
jgi:hypothetical protein